MLTDSQINAALAEKAEGWKPHRISAGKRQRWTSPAGRTAYSCPDYLTDPVASQGLKAAAKHKIDNFRRLEIHILPDIVAVMIATGTSDIDECYPFIAEDESEMRATALAIACALGVEV